MSKELWELLKQENPKPSIDDVFELADFSLNREIEWIQKSKERLSTILYESEPKFDSNAMALRNAYDSSMELQWHKAIGFIDGAINSETQSSTKGYLLQIKAKLINFIDRSKAQQILLSGRSMNMSILAPISGIRYDKIINNIDQAKAVCEYIEKIQTNQNDYVIHANAIISSLVFSPEADDFESALQKIGQLLGFASTRPEKETCGEGPDNLWVTGTNKYYVIECKSAAVSETISKDYCNQLGGAMRWFFNEYGETYSSVPVMVHKSTVIDRQATAVKDMMIITPEKLDQLKKNVNDFVIAVSQNENWKDEERINQLLLRYKLRGNDIVQNYMLNYREG